MTIVKEELAGMLTLSFGVDPLVVGTLAPHTPVKLSAADQIANAIRMNMFNFEAQTNGTDRVFIRRRNNGPVFNNTNIPISTSDDGADIIVDPSLAHDGDISILDPYGIALTDCSGPDAPIDILVR